MRRDVVGLEVDEIPIQDRFDDPCIMLHASATFAALAATSQGSLSMSLKAGGMVSVPRDPHHSEQQRRTYDIPRLQSIPGCSSRTHTPVGMAAIHRIPEWSRLAAQD